MEAEGAVGTNLVSKASISSWKSTDYGAYDWNTSTWTGFDGSSWVAASKDIVAYYMDPRNFLNDTYVFQFLHHAFDSNTQTRAGLTSLITEHSWKRRRRRRRQPRVSRRLRGPVAAGSHKQ